jgi:hypothetical protein
LKVVVFFSYIAKNLHFARASANFGYWFGGGSKKCKFLVIFDFSFQGCNIQYFALFFIFLPSLKSGNDFFILSTWPWHIAMSRRKIENFDFFSKFEKLSFPQANNQNWH